MVYKPRPGEKGIGPRWFPNHVTTELSQAIFFLALVVLVAGYFTKGLHPPADPFTTPEHIKPEWYFLPLYEILRLVPQTFMGIQDFNKPFTLILSGIVFLLLILLPWLDRTPPEATHPKKRPLIFAIFMFGLIVTLALGILGYR